MGGLAINCFGGASGVAVYSNKKRDDEGLRSSSFDLKFKGWFCSGKARCESKSGRATDPRTSWKRKAMLNQKVGSGGKKDARGDAFWKGLGCGVGTRQM